jgi:hypothetical protein
MPEKFKVHFESSAAVGVEIEVEAEDAAAAQRKAEALWMSKSVPEKIGNLIGIDQHAREGFAQAIGLTIPYAVVSLDENGFEVVDVHTYAPESMERETY